jgi:hypothetical protein
MKCALLLFSSLALGSDLLQVPYRGCVLDASGAVRAVYGVRSSFASSPALAPNALAAACSDRRIVAKTETSIIVLNNRGTEIASHPAAGPALLAFDDAGEPAYAFLTSTREILKWSGAEWTPANLAIDGEPLALAAQGDTLAIVQRRDDRLWLTRIALSGGVAEEEPLEGSASAASIDAGGAVWLAEGTSLILRSSDGSVQSLELPAAVRSLTRMNAGWLAVETEAGLLAIERAHTAIRRYFVAGGASGAVPAGSVQ